MPQTVPIEIFNIGRTQVDREEVDRWMKFIGADSFELPDAGSLTNPAALIALAGKRCYKSFEAGLNPNVTRIRKDYTTYLDNVLASRHGSVCEHSVYTFAIENISRVFTAEMNRHRAGWAISEGSMRFIRYSDAIPYWEPGSVAGEQVLLTTSADSIVTTLLRDRETPVPPALSLLAKKQLTRRILQEAFTQQEAAYSAMERVWAAELAPDSKFAAKKQITSMMRRIIGMGVATGGVWTGNIRALRHVIAMRASEQAEEEMLHVFSRVAKFMVEKEPMLFGDFEETPEGYWQPRYIKV